MELTGAHTSKLSLTKAVAIIPARFASSRLPGKALLDIGGKAMICRVAEQAIAARNVSRVIVATDDERIAEAVIKFGGEFVMTGSDHQSGTDRCAEVSRQLPDFDIVINIQGDEPFINPKQIDLLVSCFEQADVQLATLIKEIHTEEELFNHNIPKVVTNTRQEAVYFSRHTIPYIRNTEKAHWHLRLYYTCFTPNYQAAALNS